MRKSPIRHRSDQVELAVTIEISDSYCFDRLTHQKPYWCHVAERIARAIVEVDCNTGWIGRNPRERVSENQVWFPITVDVGDHNRLTVPKVCADLEGGIAATRERRAVGGDAHQSSHPPLSQNQNL